MSHDSPPVISVMVGDDGSRGAQVALGWARRLTAAVDARLTVGRASGDTLSAAPDRQDLVSKERSLEVAGPPVAALLDAGRRLQVDLIAVGRRGAGGFGELRLGSTAHQLAEHSPWPVAVTVTLGARSTRLAARCDGSRPSCRSLTPRNVPFGPNGSAWSGAGCG